MSNYDFIRTFDAEFQQSGLPPLSSFRPSQRCCPLQAGQTRKLMPDIEGDASEMRSFITSTGGEPTLEMPRHMEDGGPPTLHIFSDMGQIGAPGLNFLIRGDPALRATHFWDILHRRTDDIIDAEGDAGLRLIKAEFKAILKMRNGPFRGCANTSVLQKAATSMFEVFSDHHTNIWYQVLYPDIAEELDHDLSRLGTEDLVLGACIAVLSPVPSAPLPHFRPRLTFSLTFPLPLHRFSGP